MSIRRRDGSRLTESPSWPPVRLAELKRLRAEGLKAREIADAMGCTVHQARRGAEILLARERAAGSAAPAEERVGGAPPTETDYGDPVLRATERRLKEAQATLRSLRARLDEADEKKTVVEQLVDVIRSEITPFEPRPLRMAPDRAAQFEVDAAVSLTDEHGDEVVTGPATWGLERYNYDVFRIRLARWARVTAAYLTHHLPRYKFERLWVHKLGDATHGNLHLPGQKYRNHFGNDLRAAVAVGEAEAEAIAWLAEVVPQVIVVCVSGNHPRQTAKKDYGDPHDNLDFIVASTIEFCLRKYIDEGRVSVFAPRAWSAYTSIRGWTNALNHGDDAKGTWGIPWYGFARHEARVQAAVATVGERIDYFWYGHYHTDVGVSDNGARALHSGAFTRTDDFALVKMRAFNEPSQLLEIFDDAYGRIIEVPLYLRDPRAETAYWAGEHAPELGRDSVLARLGGVDGLAESGSFPLIKAPV